MKPSWQIQVKSASTKIQLNVTNTAMCIVWGSCCINVHAYKPPRNKVIGGIFISLCPYEADELQILLAVMIDY